MFNKAASSIEVEHTQVRRLVGSHVQQGSQQYRGRTHSGTRLVGSHVQQGSQQYEVGTRLAGITCSTRQPAV